MRKICHFVTIVGYIAVVFGLLYAFGTASTSDVGYLPLKTILFREMIAAAAIYCGTYLVQWSKKVLHKVSVAAAKTKSQEGERAWVD